jgi:hypothetical protein
MFPLGVIRADGLLFWVAQYADWDSENYDVLEIEPHAVEVRPMKAGGSC